MNTGSSTSAAKMASLIALYLLPPISFINEIKMRIIFQEGSRGKQRAANWGS